MVSNAVFQTKEKITVTYKGREYTLSNEALSNLDTEQQPTLPTLEEQEFLTINPRYLSEAIRKKNIPEEIVGGFEKLTMKIDGLIKSGVDIESANIKEAISEVTENLQLLIDQSQEFQKQIIAEVSRCHASRHAHDPEIEMPLCYKVLIRLINNASQLRVFVKDYEVLPNDPDTTKRFINDLEHRLLMFRLALNEAEPIDYKPSYAY